MTGVDAIAGNCRSPTAARAARLPRRKNLDMIEHE
jgi:hypothetical protein